MTVPWRREQLCRTVVFRSCLRGFPSAQPRCKTGGRIRWTFSGLTQWGSFFVMVRYSILEWNFHAQLQLLDVSSTGKRTPPPPRAQPSAYMASQEHLVGHYMRREETQPNGVWGLIQQGFDFVPPWG